MSESFWAAAITACWLGILTSISPCPLASNIAAISYIGKRVDRPGYVLISGLLYTMGRMITYVVLGIIVVNRVLSIPEISFYLQENMNKFLGPILVIIGLLLLGIFKISITGLAIGQTLQEKLNKLGLWGTVVLGLLFALSFCPVSAALFFGSLIPIAVEFESGIIMPLIYGIGTALPVVVFAGIIAFGANFLGTAFNRLTQFEKWARKVTGAIFVLVGFYFILIYLFDINIY